MRHRLSYGRTAADDLVPYEREGVLTMPMPALRPSGTLFTAAPRRFEPDPGVRVAVLHRSGRMFSTGADAGSSTVCITRRGMGPMPATC